MPTQNVVRNVPFTYQGTEITLQAYTRREAMYQSPRVNGKLKLRANPFSRQITKLWAFAPTGPNWDQLPFGAQVPGTFLGGKGLDELVNGALISSYNRLRGKVYKGSASLGVTAASYRQSADMIRNRYNQLTLRAEYWDKVLNRRRPVRMTKRELIRDARNLAGFHLEVIFGWMPLIQDVVAASATVIELSTPPEWISGRSQFELPFRFYEGPRLFYTGKCTGWIKRGAAISVSNPNLWLAERAGTLNAVSVAWDLVPWSFLVNMISNAGQLASSITDFVGLSVANDSVTENIEYNAGAYALNWSGQPQGSCSLYGSQKFTTLGGLSVPPLTFKLPGVNWETVTMAASLFTQKFIKLPSPVR